MRNYQKSLEWFERAQQWTPDASQTMSKSPRRYPVGAHPLALLRGDGCHVWDPDGNEYIDWSLGLAAVTLGYQNPAVNFAIHHQLMTGGISFSLPHPLEAEVAERICGVFRCANDGAVRTVKTGSEADSAACRIARRATGRDVILACGYLGWHDWAMSRAKEHPGIPELTIQGHYDDEYFPSVIDLLYGEKPSKMDYGLQWSWDNVAAIFVEPPLFPPEGLDVAQWLDGLRTLAHEHGALFVLDEIVYGGRFALGGAQDYFGVTPDLCTFGKGLANGMPLAGIAGRRELMQYADVISGTFGGETLSLAACRATLDVYQREPVIDTMWARGGDFRAGLCELIRKHDLPARIEGYAVHPRLVWTVGGDHPMERENDSKRMEIRRQLMSLWLQEMAEGGVLVHSAGWNCSFSHTSQDVMQSLEASDRAFAVCAAALKGGDIAGRLRGEVISEGFKVR